MADESGQKQTPESPAEPMPSSEQTQEAPSEVTEAAPVEGTDAPQQDDLSLPEGVKDRTAEQFEKLKSQLADERTRRMETENYIRTLQPQQTQGQEDKPLYDATTGIVDVEQLEKLKKDAVSAQKKVSAAERRFEEYVQKQQETEAYASYPQLNPKAKDFDDSLYKATRAILTDSMINPKDYGGSEITMKEAADLAFSVKDKQIQQVKQDAAKETVEKLTPKEQAGLQAMGTSGRRDSSGDLERLRQKTREGNMDAIMERLKGIPSI